jgi:hypothetical protein
MSGNWPTIIGFSSMKFTSLQPTLVSVSHSLTRQSRSRGGAQRWGIEATYPPNLLRAELAPIFAFALKQRGQWDTFTLTPPALWATARGIATGTPKIKGASQAGRNVITDGWTATQTGILLEGDFLKFAGHSKIYMVVDNANSNGSGEATLVIEPALMATPEDNEDIVVTSVPFTVALASDVREFSIDDASFHEFKVSFVEAF